jgi:polyferredoxin
MTIISSIMVYGLATRSPVDMHILHDRNPLFVKLSSGSIRNNYTIKIMNMTHDDRIYSVSVPDMPNAQIKIESAGEPLPDHLQVLADSEAEFRVMVADNAPIKDHKRDITFEIKDNQSGKIMKHNSMFITVN